VDRFRAEIAGFSREWLYHAAPAGAPLVLFLTGTGGTAEWADRETGWSKLAAREGFALAVPEALPPDPYVAPSFLKNPQRWNDGSPRLFAPDAADDVAFLSAVIDHAVGRHAADPRRVFVAGFSNGAGMAFRFAAECAERVAGVAPVAGHCWVAEPRLARPVPTLHLTGLADPLVPYRGGDTRVPWSNGFVRRPPVAETLDRWARALGCAPVPDVRSEVGPVRVERFPGPVRFDAITMAGLGHHWPGGGAQLNPRFAGPPSDALDATATIWRFFAEVSCS
jgi:polyhydroxybutyrate depolymerase